MQRLSQSRAIALDMESATIAANGFRFRVPYGTLLCVSDKPLHGELKLPGMATAFYRTQVNQHLHIGIRALEHLREMPGERLHSRKLRSFIERHSNHHLALRATVYKAELHVADDDRAYYGSHAVTVARHPSETDERLMVRLLAYALWVEADERLVFTRGLSDTDEPDLWNLDLTGAILQWVEVGLPDERRLLKACGRADQVIVLAYGRGADVWWSGVRDKLGRASNLQVWVLDVEATRALAALAKRNMSLSVNVTDRTAWVSCDRGDVSLDVRCLREAG
ncbi:AMP nucleosidase [Castellaniella denitrificans]